MSKDLHNIDDIFNSAYQQFEDNPSGDVWEKINAGLDKKDADSYKKRLKGWKRIALLLLLLLIGFILNESGFLQNGSKGNSPATIAPEKSDTPTMSAGKDQIHSTAGSKEEPGTDLSITSDNNSPEKQNQKDHADFKTGKVVTKKTWGDIKIAEQKTSVSNEKISLDKETDHLEIPVAQVILGKRRKSFLENRQDWPSERINHIPIFEKNKLVDAGSALTGIQQVGVITVSDSSLLNSTAKDTKEKIRVPFIPYWTISGFASYERAGYKLDSDQPSSVNSIKHGEVHEPSSSYGILATRQLKKHWGLQTGLIYSNTEIGMSPQKMYAFQDPAGDIAYKYVTSSGYAYVKPGFGNPPTFGDSLTAAEGKHTLRFVSVPVVFKYAVTKNKFTFSPGAGIEANFLTSAKVETELLDASNREIVFINKLNGAKSFYWSFVADAEVRYNVNKKLSINFRPALRFAISPITKNNVVETLPYSFGTGLGLTFKL